MLGHAGSDTESLFKSLKVGETLTARVNGKLVHFDVDIGIYI
jgi:hypothetical protein